MKNKIKSKASVENILKELWKVNVPAKKETPRKEAKIKEIKAGAERITPLELLEKEERKNKKSKGKKQVVKIMRTNKKEKRQAKPAKHVELAPAKIQTGIKGLDSLLGGGIERESSFVIYGTPHCGKKPVIMQMAYSALKQKIPVIFILTDFGAKKWKEMMNSSGWNMERFKDRVYIIDAYSQQYSILKDEENVTYLQVPFTLSTLSIECAKFIETCEFVCNKKPLVIFHSISTLIENFGENEVFNFMQFFLGKLGNENINSIHSLQEGMHSGKIETMIVSMMDGVLEMKDMKLRAKGFLGIKTPDWIPYRMTSKGIAVEFKGEEPVKNVKTKKAKPKRAKAKKVKKKTKKR